MWNAWGEESCVSYLVLVGKADRKSPLEDLSVHWRISKWFVKKWDRRLWDGLIWVAVPEPFAVFSEHGSKLLRSCDRAS
jgi:hypothetical protein